MTPIPQNTSVTFDRDLGTAESKNPSTLWVSPCHTHDSLPWSQPQSWGSFTNRDEVKSPAFPLLHLTFHHLFPLRGAGGEPLPYSSEFSVYLLSACGMPGPQQSPLDTLMNKSNRNCPVPMQSSQESQGDESVSSSQMVTTV